MLSERTFGVEIEHGNDHASPTTTQSALREKYGDRWAHCHKDGSGLEVVSPPLCGDAGLAELQDVMKFLEDSGGYMGAPDGMHVHHWAPEYCVDGAENLVASVLTSYCNNQGTINLTMPKRRTDNREIEGVVCYKQMTPDMVKSQLALLNHEHWDGHSLTVKCGQTDRFCALNIGSLRKYGTIEFRQHHGTFDFDRVAAWIRFGQKFVERVAADGVPIKKYRTVPGLMKSLGIDDADIAKLQEKQK